MKDSNKGKGVGGERAEGLSLERAQLKENFYEISDCRCLPNSISPFVTGNSDSLGNDSISTSTPFIPTPRFVNENCLWFPSFPSEHVQLNGRMNNMEAAITSIGAASNNLK